MPNNFYLDVFNKLLSINEHKVFIIFDDNENIWFNFRDLLNALGYKNSRQAIKDLEIDNKYLKKLDELRDGRPDLPPLKKIFSHILI
jgi:prophage antirepressor-like protein